MISDQDSLPAAPNQIYHTGVVESWVHGIARVQIYHGSNCGACPAKGGCASAGFGESGQTIELRHGTPLEAGQKVNVVLRARTDLLAILLAFGLPVILVVGTLLALVKAGVGQMAAGLASIACLLAYLGILMLLRKRLQKKFELMIVD